MVADLLGWLVLYLTQLAACFTVGAWCTVHFLARHAGEGGHVLFPRAAAWDSEMKPLIPYLLVGSVLLDLPLYGMFSIFGTAISVVVGVVWWRHRKCATDDRWGKRRERCLDRVREVAGRLVVEPATA